MQRLLAAVVLLVPAILSGIGTACLAALAANRILTATIGEAGILAIDDTVPWELSLLGISLLGVVVGVSVFLVGLRRIARRAGDPGG